mmetsp:Transcript_48328/g.65776  ORF Transcript_48328/g.65776 Transcript_48328/m.65776 type:complete len:146 (+) Transcript_48328:507-944(+)
MKVRLVLIRIGTLLSTSSSSASISLAFMGGSGGGDGGLFIGSIVDQIDHLGTPFTSICLALMGGGEGSGGWFIGSMIDQVDHHPPPNINHFTNHFTPIITIVIIRQTPHIASVITHGGGGLSASTNHSMPHTADGISVLQGRTRH